MSDLRNALAKARDQFLESEAGKRVCDGTASGIYLRNRIEAAFIAGWNSADEHYGWLVVKPKP